MKYATLLLTITTVYASFPAEGPADTQPAFLKPIEIPSKPSLRQKLLGKLTTTIGNTEKELAAVEQQMLHAPASQQAALRQNKNTLLADLTDAQLRHTELALDELQAQAALEQRLQQTQEEWMAWQEQQSLPVTPHQKALADERARQEAAQNRQEIQQILAEQKQKQEAQQKAQKQQEEAAKQKARDAVGREAAQEALTKEMLRRKQEAEAADALSSLACNSLPRKKARVQ